VDVGGVVERGPGGVGPRRRVRQVGGRVLARPLRWWLHREVARAEVRARGRPHGVPPPASGRPRPVVFLLLHAWGSGGTIRTTFTTAGALADTHDVEIVSLLRTSATPRMTPPEGVRLRALHDRTRHMPARVLGALLAGQPSQLWPAQDWAYARTSLWSDVLLVRALRAVPTGSVLVATRPALGIMAVRLAPAGVVVVHQEHQHLGHHRQDLRAELVQRLRAASLVVTLTERDRAAYVQALGPHGPPVLAIPNAVPDLAVLARDHPTHRIVAAGRLDHQKGHDLLVEAFAQVADRHHDWRLDLYGDGPLRTRLVDQVGRLGLSSRVGINPGTPGIAEVFAAAGVLALPSRHEGFPMVLLEAMASGLAVVAFDCPTGPGELITHGVDGLLVPPGDVGALAGALDLLMGDSHLRERLGRAAPAATEPYSRDRIGARWQEVVSGRPTP
jgi:glycosyltransferase involved in cell wall biosynthesis